MPTDTSDDGRLAYLTRVCGGMPTRRRFLAILPGVAGLYVSEATAKRHGGRKRRGPTKGRAYRVAISGCDDRAGQGA